MSQLTRIQEEQIARIDGRITECSLYANYWIGMATSGATTHRTVHRGDHKLTAEELIDDAMATALQHIRNVELLIEEKCKIIAGTW